jgi:hypothetical protein
MAHSPTNASAITLTISDFNTELNNDGVIFMPEQIFCTCFGQFSGTSILSVNQQLKYYVEFVSKVSN